MGKFLKYEDSNWRSFIIDTTAGTIKRPKRPITAEDMLGAVIQVDNDACISVTVKDTSIGVVGIIFVDGTTTNLTYAKATDVFILGSTTLTNVMIDEFGREEKYI
jgi:hypothetical protein